jgi:prepilin-type N-terminal cleavage/methylation domain-containing protein
MPLQFSPYANACAGEIRKHPIFNFDEAKGVQQMKQTFKRNMQKGFTLVELLIVVIILAILAAIVVPQFSSSTDDAKLASLDTNLATLRSTIELFKAQHNSYPGAAATGTAAACSGTAGTAAAGAQALLDQLRYASDANGNSCSIADANYKFGPYVRSGMPNEPTTSKGALPAEITVATTGAKLAGTAGGTGWKYDSKSGEIIAASTTLVGGKDPSTR